MESWRILLRRALTIVGSVERAGLSVPAWSLGGGTALMLHYQHRRSRDIDAFLGDPQYLPALSPRLNDVTASLTQSYVEASNFLKLTFVEGELDFIVAPTLSRAAAQTMQLEGAPVQVEAPLEVAAKKAFYRAAELKARDLFDLALVLSREPASGPALAAIVAPKAEVLRRRIDVVARTYAARAAREIDILPGAASLLGDAPEIVTAWLETIDRR